MKKLAKHAFWVTCNWYGRIFGRPWLEHFNLAILNLALHGLGYNNSYRSFTGEQWFIRDVLKRGDIRVCIDVGANVGNYARELINTLDCTVYAIEPTSPSFAQLQKCAAERPNTLFPIQKAVLDAPDTVTMYSRAALDETASVDAGAFGPTAVREEVAADTLDTIVAPLNLTRIDLIKVDVEGYEREVFRGMQKTLTQFRPAYIQFEFNIAQLKRGYTVYDLCQMLPDYEFYRLLPRGWIRIHPEKFASNIFMFSNIVAKRV